MSASRDGPPVLKTLWHDMKLTPRRGLELIAKPIQRRPYRTALSPGLRGAVLH